MNAGAGKQVGKEKGEEKFGKHKLLFALLSKKRNVEFRGGRKGTVAGRSNKSFSFSTVGREQSFCLERVQKGKTKKKATKKRKIIK